jgi:hypothetical protein
VKSEGIKMRKKIVMLIIIVVAVICLASTDPDNDQKQMKDNIKKVVESFSNGSLNKDKLLKLLGQYTRIYHGTFAELSYHDSNEVDLKDEDCGNLFVKKGEYWIGLNYETKERRDSGNSPYSVIFVNNKNGFSMVMLVEIFGRWVHYTHEHGANTKLPRFLFKNKIDEEKEMVAVASEIYGEYKSPLKCICKHFGISIKKKNIVIRK